MEIKEFIGKFAEIFDETDTSTFTPQTEFRELDEWSSLLALMAMAMVSDEYDVELEADEMRNANTIEDIFNATKAHLE